MKLIITVGLPGCGKSTYLAKLGVNAISSDEMRRLLADDPTNQTIHRRVFASVRHLIKQRLSIGRPETYVDATNLTRWERRPYIRLGQLYDATVEAIFSTCRSKSACNATSSGTATCPRSRCEIWREGCPRLQSRKASRAS